MNMLLDQLLSVWNIRALNHQGAHVEKLVNLNLNIKLGYLFTKSTLFYTFYTLCVFRLLEEARNENRQLEDQVSTYKHFLNNQITQHIWIL